MIPSQRVFVLVLAWAALGLAVSAWPALLSLWLGSGLALLLALLIDALSVLRAPRLLVQRHLPGVWPVERPGQVALNLQNDGRRPLILEIFDDVPSGWRCEGMPHRMRLQPGVATLLQYSATAPRRGDSRFGPCHIRVASSMGLWWFGRRMGPGSDVKVFPDFSRLFGQTLLATDRRVASTGIIRRRRRGEGTDFRQLREYRDGDSQRTIDWKATARARKLISREYQEERDQQVVFLLDTGRRMLAQDAQHNHFDHALNAVLTLAMVAQRQGDAIGLMTFGAEQRWLSPQKGRVGFDRLIAGSYDLQPEEVAPDYTLAASQLLGKLSKRAFVVLVTNLRDEDDEAIRTACEMLSRKHLVMCASLRESALDDAIQQPIRQFPDALRFAATSQYLQQRREAIRQIGIRANHLIDVIPSQLSVALTNRYLDIKESGVL